MIGQTISHYKITEKLGAGGMGEVYLAVDSRLDRKVALKFLPAHMAPLADVKARFMQEAKAASTINHPNVCTIYDIAEHEGRMYIVMEYIDGTTLREKTGELSISQVVEFGTQIAEGLAAAHAQGVVHRDIKTENIMLRKDGIVQVMDFGLAKLRGVSRITKEGSTIGTVGYMSPEQAQGQDVDHRTDIFSLGIVLFELLTGAIPFRGEHEAAIMYEIVNVESPPPSAIKPEIDPELDRIILECLQKEPDERYQSAKEVAKHLRRYSRDGDRPRSDRVSTVRPSILTSQATEPTESPKSRSSLPKTALTSWIVTSAALFVAVVAIMWKFAVPGPEVHVVRAQIPAPPGAFYKTFGGGHIALSPDGRLLAFVGVDSTDGESLIHIRALNATVALRLPGTEGANYPFWSADSRHVAFFTKDGKLMRVKASGGPSLTICDARHGRGGSWNADNVIIFSPSSYQSEIHRVSAAGGEPEPVTVLDSAHHDFTHCWAHFLPDGTHFLYFAQTESVAGSERDAICVGSLAGGPVNRLVRTKSDVAYANGHILYLREGTLMAYPFDPGSLKWAGDAVPIAESVSWSRTWSRGSFSASRNGRLVYQKGVAYQGTQLILFNREGEVIDSIGDMNSQYFVEFSPDESRIATVILDEASSNLDIWITELSRGISTRFTFDSLFDLSPVWSPDGSRIAFTSNRENGWGIFIKDASGTGRAERVASIPSAPILSDWSRDGRYICYGYDDSAGVPELGIFTLSGDSVRSEFTRTPYHEFGAAFSPDGRWLAFTSGESGRAEVYVVPFPGPGGKWLVSSDQGQLPRWRDDGKELYYIDNSGRIMAAEVDGSGSSFVIGALHPLFSVWTQPPGSVYDVSGDGQRFVVNTQSNSAESLPVSLVVNWPEELKK